MDYRQTAKMFNLRYNPKKPLLPLLPLRFKALILFFDRSYDPYPGGATNPPISRDSRSANVIVVASSQYGPMI